MNKFSLFFLILLIINFSQNEEFNINIENIYDSIVYVLRGISKTEKYLCANIFVQNKPKMIQSITYLIEEFKISQDFSNLIAGLGVEIIGIDNSLTECRLLNIISVLNCFFSKEGIKEMGERISNNSKTIVNLVNITKNNTGLPDKLINLGKILKIILDFYVL